MDLIGESLFPGIILEFFFFAWSEDNLGLSAFVFHCILKQSPGILGLVGMAEDI